MLEELKQQISVFLQNENNFASFLLATFERQIGVGREELALVFAGILSLYLIFGYFAQLLCNFIGFAYPAYASMNAIESSDKDDDTQWLTYWTVFAVFSLIDFAADTIFQWFPLYWLVKCLFLVYLYHPATMGAKSLYETHVRSLIQMFNGVVVEIIAAVRGQPETANEGEAALQPPPNTDQNESQPTY